MLVVTFIESNQDGRAGKCNFKMIKSKMKENKCSREKKKVVKSQCR